MTVLRVYTEYSILQGECRIKELVDRASELSYTSIGKTDVNTLAGSLEFWEYAKQKNINPLVGCQINSFLAGEKVTLLLFAKNNDGISALNIFSSFAMTKGGNHPPETVPADSFDKYGKNIIAVIVDYDNIFSKGIKNAELVFSQLKNRFGGFYVGLERLAEESTDKTEKIYRLCNQNGIKCVITNPVFMTAKENEEALYLLEFIKNGNREKKEHPHYLKGQEEIKGLFSHLSGVWENTEEIGRICDVSFDTKTLHIPPYPAQCSKTLLREKAISGLERIGKGQNGDYTKRLDEELSVIEKMGFSDYFLITEDFVSYAKEKDIPIGPGRGSGVGSLVAYVLGITNVDPLENGLLFQRFLNEERVSMPDFDIDMGDERRDEVICYVKEKYGKKHVCGIANYSKFAFRQVIRDISKYLNWDATELIKVIPDKVGITVKEALKESKELNELVKSNSTAKEAVRLCSLLEGRPKAISPHPSGIILTKEPAVFHLPLMTSPTDGETTLSQYPMDTCAKLGLLKIDFLGIKYLTVIYKAKKLVKERYGSVYTDRPPLEKKVFQMLWEGNTGGVFQLESAGMKELLKRLKPESIQELTDLISLYRPGPKVFIDSYIKGKFSKESIKYPVKETENALKSTYGCPIYQEQIMQICRDAAGFTLGHADTVRRAMAKKDEAKMRSEKESFVSGCEKNGIEKKKASELFESISSFAQYAFNKSHAAAYALLAYETAYLKCIYPREYFAPRLDSVEGNFGKIYEYSIELRKLGYEIMPPCVNRSDLNFSPCEEGIRYSISGIKGVGRTAGEKLIKERVLYGEFKTADDFISRAGTKIGSNAAVSLAKCGGLDIFGENRSTLSNLCEDSLASGTFSRVSEDQISLSFDEEAVKYPRREEKEYPETQLRVYEKEFTGIDFYFALNAGKAKETIYALYIKLDKTNRNKLPQALKDIASQKEGSIIRLYDSETGKTAELKDFFFKASYSALEEMEKIMGADNVKLKALERKME